MEEHVRVCRDCGEEYRPGIVRCADCGGELEDRFLGGQAPPPSPAPAPEAELAGRRVLFRTHRATDLVPMAERLREGAIECWLAELPSGVKGEPSGYALLVREGDARVALATVTDLVAPGEEAADVHAIETRFDPARGYVQCPACGTDQARGAALCPECGLALAGESGGEEPGE